ncbi:MAG: hypothetical protein PWQ43_1742, partial [Rikenellaceae bacterium]|nr:hypothetical protein [Rikenellaceae bacterium]
LFLLFLFSLFFLPHSFHLLSPLSSFYLSSFCLFPLFGNAKLYTFFYPTKFFFTSFEKKFFLSYFLLYFLFCLPLFIIPSLPCTWLPLCPPSSHSTHFPFLRVQKY